MSNANSQAPKTTALPMSIVRAASATPLTATDSIAIHELIARVYLAEDLRDREALQQAVTENYVQLHTLYGRIEGRADFASWVLDHPAYFDGFRHHAFNIVTKSEGNNQASAVSYIMVLQVFSDDPAITSSLPRTIAHGVVRDQFVKSGERWLLSERVYEQFSVLPAIAPDPQLRAKASAQAPAK
jgi:SnoaL-like domain